MYEMDPWGGARDDLRMGIVASTIVNVNRAKGSAPAKPFDFIPNFDEVREIEEKEANNSAQVKSLLRSLAPERKKR